MIYQLYFVLFYSNIQYLSYIVFRNVNYLIIQYTIIIEFIFYLVSCFSYWN